MGKRVVKENPSIWKEKRARFNKYQNIQDPSSLS